MTRSVSQIDDLLKKGKGLWGSLEWVEDGPTARMKSPVIDDRGVVIGGLILYLWAQVHDPVQRAGSSLSLDGKSIQRMSYLPKSTHLNDNVHPTPPALRLRSLPAGRSRIYLWSNNRKWPPNQNLRAGVVIESELTDVAASFQLFLETCAISTYLPDPPHRPMLEL